MVVVQLPPVGGLVVLKRFCKHTIRFSTPQPALAAPASGTEQNVKRKVQYRTEGAVQSRRQQRLDAPMMSAVGSRAPPAPQPPARRGPGAVLALLVVAAALLLAPVSWGPLAAAWKGVGSSGSEAGIARHGGGHMPEDTSLVGDALHAELEHGWHPSHTQQVVVQVRRLVGHRAARRAEGGKGGGGGEPATKSMSHARLSARLRRRLSCLPQCHTPPIMSHSPYLPLPPLAPSPSPEGCGGASPSWTMCATFILKSYGCRDAQRALNCPALSPPAPRALQSTIAAPLDGEGEQCATCKSCHLHGRVDECCECSAAWVRCLGSAQCPPHPRPTHPLTHPPTRQPTRARPRRLHVRGRGPPQP